MSIVLQGSTSGSVTLQEPAVAGTTVLDLPAVSGTVITTGTTGQVIASGALPIGSVLQVVTAQSASEFSTTSASYVTTGFSASITPKFATSKIWVVLTTVFTNTSQNGAANMTIYRGGTNICTAATGFTTNRNNTSASGYILSSGTISYIDSPATTSSTTYTLYASTNNVGTTFVTVNGYLSIFQLVEIAA
jgi:hypothetical protein